ncbi:MAG TPA: MFS transporter, partial [Thermoanaerobaculia bacterium]|nr:MFS transporter [Thermoanaerobaculia bacterium]
MRLRLTTRRGRLAAFFLLYLSEGIPFGFTAVTMTAYLRRHGVGLEAIGLFAASLYAPWGFKWAWAPLVDLLRSERFGASRAWIVFAQTMMILTIGVVLFFDPATQLGLVTSLIIVHNVFAATQDIAIDALAVRVLPEGEMGTANGLMFSAAYIGQAIGGSGALFVAGKLGYDAAFLFMLGALTVLLFAVSLPLLEPASAAPAPATASSAGALGAAREALARIRRFLADLYDGFFHSGRGPALGVL